MFNFGGTKINPKAVILIEPIDQENGRSVVRVHISGHGAISQTFSDTEAAEVIAALEDAIDAA